MMASTELNIGMSEAPRSSSRVLKPPGGGHSNIFAPPEVKANPPRPKYNQQNSTNLNCVMNTTDPNIIARELNCDLQKSDSSASEPKVSPQENGSSASEGSAGGNQASDKDGGQNQAGRTRVPPGGFSSGFW